MVFLSPDETLAALTAAFLGGALFGRIVWRRQVYDARIKTAADALLRRAEDQFRLVHDSSPDCVALLHPVKNQHGATDFQFVYLNPASQEFTGRDPRALIGRLVGETLPRAAELRAMRSLAELAESGQSYRDEFQLDSTGTRPGRWVALTAVRIDDAIAVTLSDVSPRKQAEAMLAASNAELERRVQQRTAELAEARERYRLLAEHASDMISTHALDGSFTYAAPALEKLVGCKSEDLRGRSPIEFAYPDDKVLIAEGRDRAHRTIGSSLVTWRCRRPDGSYVWLETNGRAVRDAKTGQPLWFVCSSRDITSRKRIEGALRESEQRLRATLETPNLVAVALDPEGVVTFCNEGLCQTTGWSRDALLGHNWFDVCMPEGAARRAFRSQMRRGTIPARFEREIVCRDGSRRLIEWDNNVLRDPLGAVIGTVSLGVDVTEKRQEETVLQLLQSITVAAGAAEDIDSALGVILESICESTHWRYGEAWLPDHVHGRLARQDVCYAAPGADVSTLIESGRGLSLAQDEGLPGTVWSKGQVAWVEDLEAGEPRPRRAAAVANGFRAICAVPVMAGHQVTAVLCFFLGAVRRRDQSAATVIATVAKQLGSMIIRISDRKRYEEAILGARDAAEAASRAKSEFLSRMSHELRTPLNSVIGFARVLRRNGAGEFGAEDLTYLDRIQANGEHLLKLVNDLLDVAKIEAGRVTIERRAVRLDALVREIVEQLEGQPRAAGVVLRADVPAFPMFVETDALLLRQILINLAGNALRFTHHGEVVIALVVDSRTQRATKIDVRDTGIGIPAERQRAIFEPFEQADSTTSRAYGGTGLGLSIARSLCDALGLGLTLESAPGAGSTFSVHLSGMERRTGEAA
jgi:PAS domain S-box-containing protein